MKLFKKGAIPLTDKYDKQPKKENDFEEEYAAEVAPTTSRYDEKHGEKKEAAGTTSGFIALTLAILSLFVFPIVFGLIALGLGIYAYSRGAKTTGGIAAIVGGIVALFALIFRVSIVTLLFSLF